ncbi:unnamed protein product [Cuscuta epithymum]|uniref:LOB domain-containing protein n=1 Tax=Cuscuta epithymum TaxID=186058 RepID=A0AAV0E2J4_9ASTE|nr:unnamed protein product [Cuscuta epithymum]
MQRSNGTTSAACASCKHQRKKCTEKCVLAPFFPAEKSLEFQAVHKVFGVSNVTKMVKNVSEAERQPAVESLVWEAVCRQNDPVLGCFGEYRRVCEELKMYKSGQYESTTTNMVIGWNYNNNNTTNGNSIVGYNNYSMNHHHAHNNNFQKLRRDTKNSTPVILPRQLPINGFNQQYFITGKPGQYNPPDSKSMDNSLWDGAS